MARVYGKDEKTQSNKLAPKADMMRALLSHQYLSVVNGAKGAVGYKITHHEDSSMLKMELTNE